MILIYCEYLKYLATLLLEYDLTTKTDLENDSVLRKMLLFLSDFATIIPSERLFRRYKMNPQSTIRPLIYKFSGWNFKKKVNLST